MTVDAAANRAIVAPTGLEFKITDAKLYVPVVTLSIENDIKLLQQLKSVFKRTITWNKYRSQMAIQPQNNNLNYLIDPTFTNVNRLFILSFSRNNENDNRDSCMHYYVPNVRIKDFNVLIDGKSFFDLPVKNEEEAYEKIIEMSNNNDYKTGNLLDFAYFEENYKLIAVDLNKQTKLKRESGSFVQAKCVPFVTNLSFVSFNYSRNSSQDLFCFSSKSSDLSKNME